MTYVINTEEVSLIPRPRKCKKVCALPENLAFHPVKKPKKESCVFLTVVEYETIRLIDKEGLSQEECGARMEVARTTVQQIYTSARRKLAEALVEGLPFQISGGDYRICGGDGCHCGCGGCKKRKEKEA